MPHSDPDQSDFMRASASPHSRLFGAAGPSSRAKSSIRTAAAARPSVSSTLPKSAARKFASSQMPDWEPEGAADWGPVIPDEPVELAEHERIRRQLLNVNGSMDADETLSASSVHHGSPYARTHRAPQRVAAAASSRPPAARAARPLPASALETIDDGETWYAHESFIPGVGRGVRTASGATGVTSAGGAVRDILNTQAQPHPSPSAASHRPQQQQYRRTFVADPQEEDASSQTSSESDDLSDTHLGAQRRTANSTGNHAALRATPLGQSRQAVRHERPQLGNAKIQAWKAAEERARSEKAKLRGEGILSSDAPDVRRKAHIAQSSPSPATLTGGSAFGRTAAMLTDQLGALGARASADAQVQADDEVGEGSNGSGFAPGPGEHDDSSGQTLLGDPHDKYAQWKRNEQDQRAAAAAAKPGSTPWLLLPSGQAMAPSAFYSHLPDNTGLTSALGSPVRARLGVHHARLGPLKQPRNQQLEGLAGYVRGVQAELGSARERISDVEQRQGAYAQKVGHLQNELGELRRQRSSSASEGAAQEQQQNAAPVRPASRQQQQQASERVEQRSAAAQHDAAPEQAAAPAPAAEISPVIAQLQAHVRRIESDLAAYKETAAALRAPTPPQPAKRAPLPRHARATQTARHTDVDSEAEESRPQPRSNGATLEVDRLRAHVRRVENEVARLRSYVDEAPRVRASSPIRPPSALRHSARSLREQRDEVSDGSEVDRPAPARAARARYAASSPVPPRARAYADAQEEEVPFQRASTPPTSRRHDTVERLEEEADETPRPASRHEETRSRSRTHRRSSSSHAAARMRANPADVLLNDETFQRSDDDEERAPPPVDEADITARAERTFEIVAPAAHAKRGGAASASASASAAGAESASRLEHNAATCTVCLARSKTERRRVRRERERARTAGASAAGLGDEAADQDALLSFLEASADLAAAGAEAPRMAPAQHAVLLRLLRECTDEFIHQRMLYSELADELKAVEPSMPALRRRIIAEHVLDAVEMLEQKAQRINALQALLPQEEQEEHNAEQQQRSHSNSRSTGSKSARSNHRAAPQRSHSLPTMDDMARPAAAASQHRSRR